MPMTDPKTTKVYQAKTVRVLLPAGHVEMLAHLQALSGESAAVAIRQAIRDAYEADTSSTFGEVAATRRG
jgi:AICAR transformylase/IMP cyclohydrolase PurH